MKTSLLPLVLCSCLVAIDPAQADPPATAQQPTSELGFLEPGKDYAIVFADGSKVFKTTKSGISATSYVTSDGKTKKGKPATWTMTLSVTMFEVVRVGNGSWALLRHPKDADDFSKWEGQRRAKAILASDRHQEIAAEPDGDKQLAKLEEAANREIETSESWFNLAHAVVIADIPTEKVEFKLSIKSAKTK